MDYTDKYGNSVHFYTLKKASPPAETLYQVNKLFSLFGLCSLFQCTI